MEYTFIRRSITKEADNDFSSVFHLLSKGSPYCNPHTTTNNTVSTKVTSIKGSGDHNPGANGLFVDNLAVYDSVLNGNDFAYLDTHGMPLSIPEPATATLGLLGLTALLVRRKRA